MTGRRRWRPVCFPHTMSPERTVNRLRPIIGITSGLSDGGDYLTRKRYADAVTLAGGIPVILPYMPDSAEEVLAHCRGLIFSGGGDVLPERYGLSEYDRSLLFEPSEERDAYELMLFRHAYDLDVPALGICRGIQVMNAALGGKIVYDIPGHRQKAPGNLPHHIVSVTPGSILHRTTGKLSLPVNSFHHQASAEPADGLIVSARSPDGSVEALEAVGKKFILGVQWHPEHMTGEPEQSALFRALVGASC